MSKSMILKFEEFEEPTKAHSSKKLYFLIGIESM
jgi:hypothetical protein